MRLMFCLALTCLLLTGCENNTSPPAQPDNTAVNDRDANRKTVTPMDQSNNSKDIDQVAAIRRAVLDIQDLSTNGRNVKIVTEGGKAVLRGPVESATERDAIQKAAEKIVGAGNVTNELEIKSN